MTLTQYMGFLAFAVVIALAPGPDFAVVTKNSLAGGRRAGIFANLGIQSGNLVHGSAAAFGVGALIVQSQVLFSILRWAGVAYLTYLGVRALIDAYRGRHGVTDQDANVNSQALRSWSQGFLSNITNPKALALFLSILPQFMMGTDGSVGWPLLLAVSFVLVDLLWLLLVLTFLHRVRAWMRSRAVRRVLDACTGAVLLGFGARLAADS